MRIYALFICLGLSMPVSAEVTSYSSKDSLRAEAPLECVPMEEVLPASTAADVAACALKCVKKKRYSDAAELVQALFAETFSRQSDKKMAALFVEIDALAPGTERHTHICNQLVSLGPPNYYPKYNKSALIHPDWPHSVHFLL